MELSIFLAQLFGLIMIIFSLSALYRPQIIIESVRSLRPYSFSALMAGFISTVAGLSIILTHNIWEFSWVGVVTLFGWAALLKGVAYVAFPDKIISTANNVLGSKQRKVALTLALLVGCYLTYHGFSY